MLNLLGAGASVFAAGVAVAINVLFGWSRPGAAVDDGLLHDALEVQLALKLLSVATAESTRCHDVEPGFSA